MVSIHYVLHNGYDGSTQLSFALRDYPPDAGIDAYEDVSSDEAPEDEDVTAEAHLAAEAKSELELSKRDKRARNHGLPGALLGKSRGQSYYQRCVLPIASVGLIGPYNSAHAIPLQSQTVMRVMNSQLGGVESKQLQLMTWMKMRFVPINAICLSSQSKHSAPM